MKRKNSISQRQPVSDRQKMIKMTGNPSKPDAVEMPEKSYLRIEDRILWETVARTTRPLRPQRKPRTGLIEDLHLWEIETGTYQPVVTESKPAAALSRALSENVAVDPVAKPATVINPLYDIDRPTIKKIAKGRLDIEARIDLHGLTQNEAHNILYGFLADAWQRGLRLVLVITGKGTSSGSEGILKQAVPHWFSTPLFRIYVSAYEDAARHHGGQGALYVRLRRTAAEKLADSNRLKNTRGRLL